FVSLTAFGGLSLADEAGNDAFATLTVVEEQDLEGLRSGDFDITTTVESTQELHGTVTDSIFDAGTIVNGSITIRDHAFENFSGIGLIVGNSGNNNAINAALGVSFHLQ
ncbi:MAG: hypothetical protein ACREBC_11240, partial [Pyrinomonadaceae bacterium]